MTGDFVRHQWGVNFSRVRWAKRLERKRWAKRLERKRWAKRLERKRWAKRLEITERNGNACCVLVGQPAQKMLIGREQC